jgi:hypothetical protein
MLCLFVRCFDKKAKSKEPVVRVYLGIKLLKEQMVYLRLDTLRASCPSFGRVFLF